jgi:hypothetical protein
MAVPNFTHLVDASNASTQSHPCGLYSNIRWHVWHLHPSAFHETHMSHRLFPTMSTIRNILRLSLSEILLTPNIACRETLLHPHYLPQPVLSALNDSTLDLGFTPSQSTVIPDILNHDFAYQRIPETLSKWTTMSRHEAKSLSTPNILCGETIVHATCFPQIVFLRSKSRSIGSVLRSVPLNIYPRSCMHAGSRL